MPLEAGSAVTTSAGRTAPSGLLQPTHIETEDEPSSIVVVVTGGTATTVAALALQLDAYTREGVHGSMLTLTQLLDLAQMLSEEGGHARLLQMHPALLTQERAQTLLGGVCGLLGLAQCFGLWSGSVEKQAGDIVLAGRDSGDGGGSEEKVVGIVHGGVMHVHGFAVSDFDLLDGALAELLAEHNALPDDDWEGDV